MGIACSHRGWTRRWYEGSFWNLCIWIERNLATLLADHRHQNQIGLVHDLVVSNRWPSCLKSIYVIGPTSSIYTPFGDVLCVASFTTFQTVLSDAFHVLIRINISWTMTRNSPINVLSWVGLGKVDRPTRHIFRSFRRRWGDCGISHFIATVLRNSTKYWSFAPQESIILNQLSFLHTINCPPY